VRSNKIRLTAIEITGVTPPGAAPVLLLVRPDRMRRPVFVARRTRRDYRNFIVKLQTRGMIEELPWEAEFFMEKLAELPDTENLGRIMARVE
jgi:hypothetical protein